MEFMQLVKEKSTLLDIDQSMLSRAVNEGFSGGEKKRNEIFQMALLEPKLAILDETDSGLDIDALKLVANGVNAMRGPDARHHRRHALPAAAQLHRARLRARAERRPHRQVRRQGAGARARGEGLRLARDRRGDGEHERDDAGRREASALARGARAAPAGRPALAAGPARSRAPRASRRSASRRRATRSGASRTSRRSPSTEFAPAPASAAPPSELAGRSCTATRASALVFVNGRFVAGRCRDRGPAGRRPRRLARRRGDRAGRRRAALPRPARGLRARARSPR